MLSDAILPPRRAATAQALAAQLQRQIDHARCHLSACRPPPVSTGCPALDALFPGGGIRAGVLVEWIGEEAGSGAGTLALAVGQVVAGPDRPRVLIDPQHELFPLGLAAWGVDLAKTVFVRPANAQEALWACETALRWAGVGLVWARLGRVGPLPLRRLQLAAEQSGGVGFLVRPACVLGEPSWAEVRLRVRPRLAAGGMLKWRVEVVCGRGAGRLREAEVQLAPASSLLDEGDGATTPTGLRVVPGLADPAAAS
jgi:hypothetical protein